MSKIKFEKIESSTADLNKVYKAKITGNVIQLSSSQYINKGNYIKKIDKDRYVNLKKNYRIFANSFYQFGKDGEILDQFVFTDYTTRENDKYNILTAHNTDSNLFQDFLYYPTKEGTFYKIEYYKKNENRSQSPSEIRKTFKKIEDLVNCNASESHKCKFITLTYKENMMDRERLYYDFNNFKKKLIRTIGKFEYISVAEPQGRGAWHLHTILLFNTKAPYIANSKLQSIWGHGFTKTKNIKNNNNLGIYLTAYLSNIPVKEFEKLPKEKQQDIVNFLGGYKENIVEKEGKKKRFIKGGRLYFYPVGFNILRTSRGIKRPVVYTDTKQNILTENNITDKNMTYQSTTKLTITDDSEKVVRYENTFHKEFYNKKII